LGLLAILMTSLAPTVSQALAAHDRLGQALATYCTADPADSPAAQDGKSKPLTAHWQACAYCGLMAHVPTLPGSIAVFSTAISVVRAPLLAIHRAVLPRFSYSAAQPRAPPVLV
jgi:hypothetical protein